jgi:glutathione S-transferase
MFLAEKGVEVPSVQVNTREREQFDGELVGREYIAGKDFTVADITAICGFGIGRVAKIRIPEELANLTRWHRKASERPSVASTSPAAKKG